MREQHPRIRTALVLVVVAVLFGACGAAAPAQPAAGRAADAMVAPVVTESATPVATLAPASGIVLELAAEQPAGKDVGFDRTELRGPADMTFEIDYANDDAMRHDFAVVPEAGRLSQLVFKSEMVAPNTSAVLTVDALPAGTYDFVCSLHATTMRGTLTLE